MDSLGTGQDRVEKATKNTYAKAHCNKLTYKEVGYNTLHRKKYMVTPNLTTIAKGTHNPKADDRQLDEASNKNQFDQ